MKKSLSIFYIYYDSLNVMPIHTHEVITHLDKNGNHIKVFGRMDKNFPLWRDNPGENITLLNVPVVSVRFIDEPCFLAALFFRLLVHCYKDRPDIIYVRHAGASLVATIAGRLFKIPVCLEINDITIKRTRFAGIYRLKKLWIRFYELISFFLADSIMTVTDGISDWIANNHRVPKNVLTTIPNGVDTDRFLPGDMADCRQKFDLPQDSLVVGYLGSFFPWAGLEIFVDAAPLILEKYPSVLFVLGGGNEPYYSHLQNLVAKKNLHEKVRFFGAVNWEDASDFINAMDICVAPACFENLESGISSQKVLAYLACGKPVIGSDIPGLGDMLEDQGVGRSFIMGNHKSLAKSAIFLLDDMKRTRAMKKKCRDFAVNRRSWAVIVRDMEVILNRLANR